jgi:WD40 repeat protein
MNSLKGHNGDIYAVCIYKDKIVSAGHDKSIRVWNSLTGSLIYKIDYAHSHVIRALDIYSGPSVQYPCIITGSWDTTCKVFNLLTGKSVYTLAGHTNRVKCVYAVSTHEAHESPYCYSGADDGTIICWNIALGVSQYVLNGHSRHILALDACITPILKTHHTTPFPISFSENGFVTDLQAIDSHHNSELDLSNQISILASGSSDRTIILWEMKSGKQIRTIDSHTRDVVSLVFTLISDSTNYSNKCGQLLRYICSGSSDGVILVHNVDKGTLVYALEGHTSLVSKLCLSCRNILERNTAKSQISSKFPYLLSVCNEGIIRCWDLDTGKEDKIIGKVTSTGELVDRNSQLQGCILHSINIEIIYRSIENKTQLSPKKISKNPITKVIQNERPSSRPGSVEKMAGEVIVVSGEDSLLFMISMEKILNTSQQINSNVYSTSNKSGLDKMLGEIALQSSNTNLSKSNRVFDGDEISIMTTDTSLRQEAQLKIENNSNNNNRSRSNNKNKNSLYGLDHKNNKMSSMFNSKSSSKLVSNLTNDIINSKKINNDNKISNEEINDDVNEFIDSDTRLYEYFKLEDEDINNSRKTISVRVNSPNSLNICEQQDSPSSIGKKVTNLLSNLQQPEPSPFTKYMNDNEIVVSNTPIRGSKKNYNIKDNPSNIEDLRRDTYRNADLNSSQLNQNGMTTSAMLSTIHNNKHESYYRSSHSFDKSNALSHNSNGEINNVSNFKYAEPIQINQLFQLFQTNTGGQRNLKVNSNIHKSNQISQLVNKVNAKNNLGKTNVVNQQLVYSDSSNNMNKSSLKNSNNLKSKIISTGLDIPNLLTRKYYNHNKAQKKGNVATNRAVSIKGLTGNQFKNKIMI